MIIPANIIAKNNLADVKISFEVNDELMQWADIVVWQRQYKPNLLNFAKKYKGIKKQIFELDDDLFSLTPANPAYIHYPNAVLKQLIEFIKTCDAVTCSTEPLRHVLSKYHNKVYTVQNCILSNYIIPPNKIENEIRIGWVGSAHHHDDLKYAIHAIKEVQAKYKNVKLVFMGGTIDKYFDMFDRSRMEFHNWVDFKDYYDKLNSLNLHIGLAPVEDNKFNCSKSNLRFLEYSLCGAATIASDVYPYSNAIENDKDGIIVKKNKHTEWVKSLTNLIENPNKITELCSNSQVKIREKYDYYKNIGSWVNVYNEVLGDTKRVIINSEVSSGYIYTKPEYKGKKEIQVFSQVPSMEGLIPEFLKHTPINESEIKNILIIKLDHLGDVILAIPAMKMVRDKFPDAIITILCATFAKAIVERIPYVDDVVTFDFFNERSENGQRQFTQEELKELKKVCTTKKFDLAIDLRRHHETRGVLSFTNAKYKIGYEYFQSNQDLLTTCVKVPDSAYDGPKRFMKPHITSQLCHLVSTALNIDRSIPVIELLEKEDDHRVFEKYSQLASGFIGIHPGTGSFKKQWPIDNFSELINMLNSQALPIVLFGTQAEKLHIDFILDKVVYKDRVMSLCNKISLQEFIAIIKKCKIFVGNDAGPGHIASLRGVPVFSIFSGIVSPYEWGAIGKNTIIFRTDMECSPCYNGHSPCVYDRECLKFISPKIVYNKIIDFLEVI